MMVVNIIFDTADATRKINGIAERETAPEYGAVAEVGLCRKGGFSTASMPVLRLWIWPPELEVKTLRAAL